MLASGLKTCTIIIGTINQFAVSFIQVGWTLMDSTSKQDSKSDFGHFLGRHIWIGTADNRHSRLHAVAIPFPDVHCHA